MKTARADGDLRKLQHVIVIVQKNHSFDNYFGALALAPGSPYHAPPARDGRRGGRDDRGARDGCPADDHLCVDGLACKDRDGQAVCANTNPDGHGGRVASFHDGLRCIVPDVNHSWVGSHEEASFEDPNGALESSPDDGFVIVNDETEQVAGGTGTGVATATATHATMKFYDQDDIPFYYDLAQRFAIDDRYFSSLLGSSFPNRSYLMAATSFGHVTTNDSFPPPAGPYAPVGGTIFDALDAHGVTWADYFQDVPQGGSFRLFSATAIDPHFLPLPVFLAQAAGEPGVGPLPQVSFVDANFGVFDPTAENDEHPPTDLQRGQAFVSQVIAAVRNGPNWKDSIVLLTYDEGGGFYDHVAPPRASQGGARTPDGVFPGQCEDLSSPPASLLPGGGAECAANPFSADNTSVNDAVALCPALAADPTGPFPAECAAFDQLGFRVPFVAVSPFSKSHYVSHTVGDHTSILALIEERFLAAGRDEHGRDPRPHLTARDAHADPLEDLFDFDRSPSLDTAVLPPTALPADDCSTVPTGSTSELD